MGRAQGHTWHFIYDGDNMKTSTTHKGSSQLDLYSTEYRPLPLASPGTDQRTVADVLAQKHVATIVKPIFDAALEGEVPRATLSNSMTIPQNAKKLCWRPNNYRRKMRVRIAPQEISSRIQGCYTSVAVAEHSKLITIRDYPRVVLMLGKQYVTGIWSQQIISGVKETFLIWSDSSDGIKERIGQKVEEIRAAIDAALFDFAERFGLQLSGEVPVWDRYEDWFRDEGYVDKLPRGTVVHDSYFKKVYEFGLEFTQSDRKEAPGENLQQYMGNRALEDFAPMIAAELFALRKQLAVQTRAIEKLQSQVMHTVLPPVRAPSQKKLSGWSA